MDRTSRFKRQMDFPGIGPAGQQRLFACRVAVAGCGGLGSTLASCMGRAGIKAITLIDPDIVDLTNLHRQLLFDESDAEEKSAKAEAAARRISDADSAVEVRSFPESLDAENADRLLKGHDLVLDGLDNMESRYILNDWCVQNGVPWVYGGVAGSTGMVLPVLPGKGPCLRCVFPGPPERPGPGIDRTGIVNTLPAFVASVQVTEGLKILLGNEDPIFDLRIWDIWTGEYQRVPVKTRKDCRCCG